MKWTVENVPELRGYTIEWAEPDNFYLSRRNRLFHSTSLKPPFNEIAVIDAPFWREAASLSRIAQRVLRFIVTNVIPLNKSSELFVTFDKSVGVVRDGKYQELKGLARPCRVLRSACAIDQEGDIFLGEYLANNKRGEMRIYKYSCGNDALEVVYSFPPSSIKHVHGLYFDKFTRSLFCLTGDAGNECQILRSFDGFKTIDIIGRGDETWRAVSILFGKDFFYYGTDAEFRDNNIYEVNRETLERKNLGAVTGTVYYSQQLGEDLFFTTTAENAPSQKENVASLWHIGSDGNCKEVVKFKKDFWNQTVFSSGTIHFPGINKLENELYFHLIAVEGDNQTFRVASKI
jgi:hypothetical protein